VPLKPPKKPCQFCNKPIDIRGLKNHERICEKNPDRETGRPKPKMIPGEQSDFERGFIAGWSARDRKD
jgi:hypothetical protein